MPSQRLALLVLIACSKTSTTLPDDFAGSYTHTTTQQSGPIRNVTTDELTVSQTGVSEKSDDPMGGAAVSDVFVEVSCGSATHCRFKTKQKCDGSIDKNPDGSLTVIASGACTEWSGSWTR